MYHNLVSLPTKEVMIQRLQEVERGLWYQMHLYPEILKSAGHQVGPTGVVIRLQFAIQKCNDGMPPLLAAQMQSLIPKFIDALVMTTEVAEEAKLLFEREQLFIREAEASSWL